jgi:hypothetical protein
LNSSALQGTESSIYQAKFEIEKITSSVNILPSKKEEEEKE